MTSLGERLDGIHLRVRVPGTEIDAELRNRKDITISFGEGGYEFMNERGLERYLSHLARLLYVGWLREYRIALSDSDLHIMGPEDEPHRKFLEARAELRATGASSDGRITLSGVGLTEVEAHIQSGTVRALSEKQFIAGFIEAVHATIEDQQKKVRELKVQFLT